MNGREEKMIMKVDGGTTEGNTEKQRKYVTNLLQSLRDTEMFCRTDQSSY
jgi:hypothetical protein